jgi:hypothetical protein
MQWYQKQQVQYTLPKDAILHAFDPFLIAHLGCPKRCPYQVVYLQVTVTEVNLNISSSVILSPTNKTEVSHWFVVHYGGHYRVTVQTNSDTAIPAKPVEYLAPPIQPPHQLQVLPERNGSYIVYWKERGLPDAIKNMT